MKNRELNFKLSFFEKFLRYGLVSWKRARAWKNLGINFSGKMPVKLGFVYSLCGVRLADLVGCCRWFLFFGGYGNYGRKMF